MLTDKTVFAYEEEEEVEEAQKAMDELAGKLATPVAEKAAEIMLPVLTEKVVDQVIAKLPAQKAAEGTDEKEKQEQAVEFVKAVFAGDEERRKALTSGTSNAPIPTAISSEIIRLAEDHGTVRRLARKWPMAGMKESVPTLSSVTAYRVDTDGNAITSSAPTMGVVSLTAKTVGIIVPVSKRLLRNATYPLVQALQVLAAEAFAKLEDKWAIQGISSGEGLFQKSGVPELVLGSGDTTYSKVEPEDLLDLMDKVDAAAITDKMRWVMSLSLLNALRKKRAVVGSDNQGFLFQGIAGVTPSTIWDIEYELMSQLPKTADASQAGTVFGGLVNFDHVIFGDEGVYDMQMSDVATVTDTDGSTLINGFQQEVAFLKFTESIDIQLAEHTKAMARLKTAAS